MAWLGDQPYRENWIDPIMSDNSLSFHYPPDWSALQVYALSEGTNELLDWAQIHRTWSYSADVIVDQSSEKRFTELLEEWETQTVEFKSSVNPTNAHDFVQTIVAFSNTDGGTIFVGVDDNGTVLGVRNSETLQQTVANVIEEFCEPVVVPNYQVVESGILKVLAVGVPPGKNRPYVHRPSGAIYVRRGSHDRPARRDEILGFLRR